MVPACHQKGAQMASYETGTAGDQHPVALNPRLCFGLRLAVSVGLCISILASGVACKDPLCLLHSDLPVQDPAL